jgi:alpha-aminoadipic semialdehyde synthase
MNRVGIRREDKSEWERRVPLSPQDLRALGPEPFYVESSVRRVFTDDEFRAAGIRVADALPECDVILGVKEIPVERLRADTAYVFFSHTIKGQPYNMAMLRRLLELGCTLIDYERIVDDDGQRLVAFGRHAGLAGAIDTLWSLGQVWQHRGLTTPLAELMPAHGYESAEEAKHHIGRVAAACRTDESFMSQAPVVIGVAGAGRVAHGAMEVLNSVQPVDCAPDALKEMGPSVGRFVRVQFEEEQFAERRDGGTFDRSHYYQKPEAYRGIFETRYAPDLTALINCIYWEPRYPRLLTRSGLRAAFSRHTAPKLVVVGDISCDIAGSIEATVKATDPSNPAFLWDARREQARDGFDGEGLLVMAVDILPAELPRDASYAFSRALSPLMPSLLSARLRSGVHDLHPALRRGVIVDRGELTPDYQYLASHL